MPSKELFWVGSALEDLREFPEDARREAGHQLHLVQLGLAPADWKSMTSVGVGVYEIRIHTTVEHRVFYIAKFSDAVYVLHAFEKKSQRTLHSDLTIARQRLAVVVAERKERAARTRRRER